MTIRKNAERELERVKKRAVIYARKIYVKKMCNTQTFRV